MTELPPPAAGPHAGFSYSGLTAAHAYKAVQPAGIRRVFVLGPSHHHFLRGCAVSACAFYDTPAGRRVLHSPCSNYGLPSNMMALITSICC